MKFTYLIFILLLLPLGCGTTNPPIANSATTTTVSSSNTESRTVTTNPQEPAKMSGMTKAHNQVRKDHQLPPLQWSNKLSVYAQQWANYLATKNGCVMQHRPISGAYKRIYGENIFWASPRRWSDGRVQVQPIDANDVVFSWADEEKYYNYNNNSCKAGEQCGHYTQLVWKNSTAVGCGMAICPDKGQMWVCSYNPPGNYIGQKPY